MLLILLLQRLYNLEFSVILLGWVSGKVYYSLIFSKSAYLKQTSNYGFQVCRFLVNWNYFRDEVFLFSFIFSWSYRAFDTLAKALNPGESAACQNSESVEANVQLGGGETSMNIVEIEGPLLSDAHVAFRVLNTFLSLAISNHFNIVRKLMIWLSHLLNFSKG